MHMYLRLTGEDRLGPLQEANTGVGGGIDTNAVDSGPGNGGGTDTNTAELTTFDILSVNYAPGPGTTGGTDTQL